MFKSFTSRNLFQYFILLWISVAIYAFSVTNIGRIDLIRNIIVLHCSPALLFVPASSGAVYLLLYYLATVKYVPVFYVRSVISFLLAMLLIYAIEMITIFTTGKGNISIYHRPDDALFIVTTILALLDVAFLLGIKKVGASTIHKTIHESCRYMLNNHFGLVLVVNVYKFLSTILLIFVSYASAMYLTGISNNSKYWEPILFVLMTINVFGLFWMIFFLYDFIHLILCDAFIESSKRELETKHTFVRLFSILAHFRSSGGYYKKVCYGSSVLSIFSQIAALFKYSANISCSVLLYIFLIPRHFTIMSYNFVVSKGTSYSKSTKYAIELISNNASHYVTMNLVVISIHCLALLASFPILTFYDGLTAFLTFVMLTSIWQTFYSAFSVVFMLKFTSAAHQSDVSSTPHTVLMNNQINENYELK